MMLNVPNVVQVQLELRARLLNPAKIHRHVEGCGFHAVRDETLDVRAVGEYVALCIEISRREVIYSFRPGQALVAQFFQKL